jgi:enoyl-CoA hydratase/carnithine racemase
MAEASSSVLRYEKRGGKAYLTLNRPEAMNALNFALRRAIDEAIDKGEADDEVLVFIVIGEGGRAFSAGADLKEMSRRDVTDSPQLRAGQTVGDKLATCGKPVIAAIDGYCLAGGLELALRCDIRIATEQSSFGLPEPRRSLLAGYGLHHLSRMVPLGEALHMQLTGSPITSQRAYEIGLIQRRVKDRAALLAEVEAVADDICLCAPLAVRAIKDIVKTGRNLPAEYSVKYGEPIERWIYGTEDRLEGPRAFVEKRKPQWKMR